MRDMRYSTDERYPRAVPATLQAAEGTQRVISTADSMMVWSCVLGCACWDVRAGMCVLGCGCSRQLDTVCQLPCMVRQEMVCGRCRAGEAGDGVWQMPCWSEACRLCLLMRVVFVAL